MKPYIPIFNESKQKLEECIVVGSQFRQGIHIAKNRDRAYTPSIHIVHELINKDTEDELEIAYIIDEITGWIEGINSNGIAILNTALIVGYDEKEGKIIKKTGVKGKDGIKILRALKCEDIDSAIKSLTTFTPNGSDNILNGHTIVADKKSIYRIEATSEVEPIVKKVNISKLTVRTNHGYEIPDAGYTDGDSYDSSVARLEKIRQTVNRDDRPITILKKMQRQFFKKRIHMNPFRDTLKMRTTSQLLLDTTNLVMYFYPVPNRCVFNGIEVKLPKSYNNKITIRILTPEDFE